MFKNAFIGRTAKPTETDLSDALGSAGPAWNQLLADFAHELGVDVHEWKSYAPKWGWSLRVLRKKRTIVWLSPGCGRFEVLFILGDKAMQAARVTKLPKGIVRALDAAPKYPEGSGVRLKVKSPRGLGALKQLATIKLQH